MGRIGKERTCARVPGRTARGLAENLSGIAGSDPAGSKQHPTLLRMAETGGVAARNSPGSLRRPIGASAGIGGLLCARWAVSLAFDVADDGDTGTGRGRAADSRSVAAS